VRDVLLGPHHCGERLEEERKGRLTPLRRQLTGRKGKEENAGRHIRATAGSPPSSTFPDGGKKGKRRERTHIPQLHMPTRREQKKKGRKKKGRSQIWKN